MNLSDISSFFFKLFSGKHIRDLSKKNLSLDKTMKIIRMEETFDQRETLIIINVHLTMSNMLRRKKHDDSNFVH